MAGGVIVAAMAACLSTTDPLPLNVTIQKPASISTADSATFVISAQGNSLIGIEIQYGDGQFAPYTTAGARTATVSFRHRYTLAGTYQVTATATDAVLGQKQATVQVSVQ